MWNDDKQDGKVTRLKDNSIEVSVLNEPGALGFDGVICKNPSAPEEKRVYAKRFHNRKIYAPEEYDAFISENLCGKNLFVMSINGYSRITPEQCRRYGVKEGDYEAACTALGRSMIKHLKSKFKSAQFAFTYGASYMGVDKAVEEVAKEFGTPLVGLSCPRYMLYAQDNDIPVYVSKNRDLYSDNYIKTLDLLITTGGREQTLKHDVMAACLYNKNIHFVDILNSLSASGGVPATITDEHGRVRVDNAAAAMGRNITFFTRQEAISLIPADGDIWDAIFSNANRIATGVCRQKMPHEYKFTDV